MYLIKPLKFSKKVLRKVWQMTRIHLLLKILGFWHRRESQYVHTGQVALCCIAKMENAYIRFFVEYYARLGFDKMFVYDNNDENGESFHEVIGDYIDSGLVEVIDFRGRPVAQLTAYQDCYDRHGSEFEWIAFFDCDEFLTFADGTDNVHAFLSHKRFLPYQVMHINWKVYSDSGLLDNDGRNITERFSVPLPDDTLDRFGTHLENMQSKSIVRGGLSAVKWEVSPHTPYSEYYYCCNPEGERIFLNSRFMPIDFRTAYLRHYRTKTIGEWVRNKMKRGYPDQPKEDWAQVLGLDMFFYFNERTAEKEAYAKEIMERQ